MLLRVTEKVNKREGSLVRTALAAAAWAVEGLYIDLLEVQKQAYGTSATGDYLDLKVAERGLKRQSATKEVCILKCNLNSLELNFQFGDSSGYTWNVTSAVLGDADSEGLYSYYITCQTSGVIAEPEGDLRPLSFLSDLKVARFGDIVLVGEDDESDDDLRKRYEESLVEIAFAGNVDAYREKILETEFSVLGATATVGALQVYAVTNAVGTISGGNVKIWIVNSDFEVASSALVAAVQETICPMYNGVAVGLGNGFAPIGASVHIATATTTPILTVDIAVTLSGASLDDVSREIKHNVLLYVLNCMKAWATQIKSPFDQTSITIREAFIYAASLVSGVSDVRSVTLKKDGVAGEGSVSWYTTGGSMEWIVLDDVIVNVTQ